MGLVGLLLILAVVQGLAEFLPVSSSGHLVLLRSYVPGGARLPADSSTEVLMHLGTLFAVLVHYRREVAELLRGTLGVGADVAEQRRLAGLLLAGSAPAAAAYFALRGPIESTFASPRFAAAMLLVTGAGLWWSRRLAAGARNLRGLALGAALAIGAAQALALLPGISRSGATIVAGMAAGLGAESAATFSFLLSLIAVGGAVLLEGPRLLEFARAEPEAAGLGVLACTLVGLAALRLLVRMGRSRRLWWFAPYCWAAGLAGLGWGFAADAR